ncbi:N-terminal nucleophile aminohydrolase [Annulohypoxylon maeteangense]|uniref:N-terminal nucleophile aminohydrolase n=1 Tax=Annulohypoxylon maeteangense TaxID=1927788 RepID=UPI0020078AB1|nr:N-terminal nucleophile aminohydrolase [Annulohypoxylon maeteangense]KAI0885159.1 N-terminal nucleophile aminohydrolase [Annulohypoxylon maeteangense]
MCRFLVYRGSDEILLSKLILDPTHSILKQSFDSRLRLDTRRGQNNADGFGIGFYTDPKLGAAPCIFTSTIPAWNCTNLHRIASKTASRLVFAHVRATTEGSLSEDNCHPFYHGSLMFMHNGGLGGWKHIKRRLGERLHDKWYLCVQGGTDSEWAFALFCDRLERLGVNPSSEPKNGFGPSVMRKALLQTIEIINELTMAIPESIIQSENVDTRSLLNFAVTDGHSIICTRYVSSKTDQAASLYYSSGTQWETKPSTPSASNDHDYQMERRDKGADIVLVASEPLTFERENWVNVPTNSILTIHGQTVMVNPIIDAFSDRDPYHQRSSAFAQTKGLTTNEKAATRVASPISTPGIDLESQRRILAPLIPSGIGRSRTPEGPSLPIRPKTSLAYAESSLASDIRLPPSDPPPRPTARPDIGPKHPSQGNIKKKRRSLNFGEQPHPADHQVDTELPMPDSPIQSTMSRAPDYTTSEKAARVLGMSL